MYMLLMYVRYLTVSGCSVNIGSSSSIVISPYIVKFDYSPVDVDIGPNCIKFCVFFCVCGCVYVCNIFLFPLEFLLYNILCNEKLFEYYTDSKKSWPKEKEASYRYGVPSGKRL